MAPEVIASLESLSVVPLSAAKLRNLTSRNPILAKVRNFVHSGWPLSLQDQPAELKPFWHRKHELSVQDDVLLWGSRVVVPDQARPEVLLLLHETHLGISRMKSLARQFVWWPNLDTEIETVCKELYHLSNTHQGSPSHSVTSLGMATNSLESSSCRLCRIIPR